MSNFTGYYAAWFKGTDGSWFEKPQKLYTLSEFDEEENTGWQKGGNHDAPLSPGFHSFSFEGSGCRAFVSEDKDAVRLVIDAVTQMIRSVHEIYAVEPKKLEQEHPKEY